MRILTFIVILSINIGFSQDSVYYWNGFKFTENDLQITADASRSYQFDIRIVPKWSKEKQGKTTYAQFISKAVLHKKTSWINSSENKENQLRLGNIFLDYAEYKARLLDYEKKPYSFRNNLQQTFQTDAEAMFGNIAVDCQYGKNEQQLIFWEKYCDSLLSITPRAPFPETEFDRFSLGYGFGPGNTQLMGNLGNYFVSPFSTTNTIYVSWKRMNYSFQLSIAGKNDPLQAYYHPKWEFGDTAVFRQVHNQFTIGYDFVRKPKFILTPFLGFTVFRQAQVSPVIPEGSSQSPARLLVSSGLMFDWRSQSFYETVTSSFRYGLNFRVLYSPVKYMPNMRGSSIHSSISLMIYLDSMKEK
jgi:hypothetical protein